MSTGGERNLFGTLYEVLVFRQLVVSSLTVDPTPQRDQVQKLSWASGQMNRNIAAQHCQSRQAKDLHTQSSPMETRCSILLFWML